MHFYQHIAHSHNNIIQTSRQSSSSIKFMIQKSTKAFPFFLLATNAIYKNNICSFLCQEIFLSKETFSFYLFPSVDIECIISSLLSTDASKKWVKLYRWIWRMLLPTKREFLFNNCKRRGKHQKDIIVIWRENRQTAEKGSYGVVACNSSRKPIMRLKH